MRKAFMALLLIMAVPAASGCERLAGGQAAATKASAPTHDGGVVPKAAVGVVTKVVFIGQAEACDCTRKRTDKTWSELQRAMAGRQGIEVERINRDTDGERTGQLTLLRPMVTVPGVYFLDRGGAIVELLQGEVGADQFDRVLSKTDK